MDSGLVDFLVVLVIGLFLVAWPVCLVLAAQRGQWVWFVAMIFVWFLVPFYFFQIAADRKHDARAKIQRRRKHERSLAHAKDLAELKREIRELKEKLG